MKSRVAREKIQVKAPDAKGWKKIAALFDEGSIHEHVNPKLLGKLGVETDRAEGFVTLHVKIMGEEYSWPFRVSDLNWKRLKAEMVFGQEFMKIKGVILKSTPKGMKIEYAPGYPQGPVI